MVAALRKILLLCAVLGIGLTIQAQITASKTEDCVPFNVTFTAPAGATNILWIFGNGTSSTKSIADNLYVNPGNYTVTFSGLINGVLVKDSLEINAYAKPLPYFTTVSPTKGCIHLNVMFKDSSQAVGSATITAREWFFGDGTPAVPATNPTHGYHVAGLFNVTLKVTDSNGCNATYTEPNLVQTSELPTVVLESNPNPPVACNPPLNVTFSGVNSTADSTAGPGLLYRWDFGDSTYSSVANPPSKDYTTNGTYIVKLAVTDDIGCSDSAITTVSINNPVASLVALGATNDTICETVLFENKSTPGALTWNFGDGVIETRNDSFVFHTYPGPGTYTVSLNLVSGSCTDDTTITVIVEDIVADFSTDPTFSCSSPFSVQYSDQSTNASQWIWFFGDSTFGSGKNPVHTYAYHDTNPYHIYDTVLNQVTLIAISPHGCVDTITKPTDTLFIPTALFAADKAEGCAPLEVEFSDSSLTLQDIVYFEWHYGDGSAPDSGPGDSLVTHIFQNAGEYDVYLVIENSLGCRDTSHIITIDVGNPPNTDFSIDPTVTCPWDTVRFTDLTPPGDSVEVWHYNADNRLMHSCQDESDPFWTFHSETGLQDITLVTAYNGCYDSVTIPDAINVLGPIAHISHTCSCDSPFVFNFSADIFDVDSMVWDFGDGNTLGTTTNTDPRHKYDTTGDYTVFLTAFNNSTGCEPYKESLQIKVRDIKARFVSDTLLCAGESYSFDARLSQDVHEYCHRGYWWDFGPNQPMYRTDTAISGFSFQGSGLQDIRLIVRDENWCYDTVTHSIELFNLSAGFIADSTIGCLPLPVNFTDTSSADTTIVRWTWNFDDGDFSTLQNPSHTFTQLDTHTVTLTIEDTLGCMSQASATIIPTVPNATFGSIGSRLLCVGKSIRFIPFAQNVQYLWEFGDGLTSTDYQPLHVYDSAGTFSVTLTIEDSLGCSASKTVSNYVFVQNKPEAGFYSSLDSVDPKCYGEDIDFFDTSVVAGTTISKWDWDLGDGSPVVSMPQVNKIYPEPGVYDISLIVSTSFGCSDTIEKTLTFVGPVADFDLVPNTICKGESIEFTIKDTADVETIQWNFGDGTDTMDVLVVRHAYDNTPPGGQTNATLVIWSKDSVCSANIVKPIFIHEVVADFERNGEIGFADTVHCIGTADSFTNQSINADSWNWDFGDGTTLNGNNTPFHTYTDSGEYDIMLAVSNSTLGCTDTIIKSITINELPDISATGGAVCHDDTVTLSASGGTTYSWKPTTGLSDSTIANPQAYPEITTNYTVTIIDDNNCSRDSTVEVFVYQPPREIDTTITIVIGATDTLVIGLGPRYVYTWTPDYEISCLDCDAPVVMPLVDTIYSAIVQDSLGCFEVPDTFRIIVKPLTNVGLPTAFTPGGNNPKVYVEGWGIKSLIEFKIFNRWGQIVFETTDLEEGWDGTFHGTPQNIDTYYYTVTVETWVDGKTISKKGTITLLR